MYLQSWTTSNAPNAQASSSVSAEKPSQPSSEATQDGMKELPAVIVVFYVHLLQFYVILFLEINFLLI